MLNKMSVSEIMDFNNPVFCEYISCATILLLKMLLMAPLTAIQRFRHSIFISREDHAFLKNKNAVYRHEDVERVRRAHRNDLENILMYFMVGFVYMLTSPEPSLAQNLFRIFTLCRCLHTFVYAVYVIPQPARFLVWNAAYLITVYMSIMSFSYFYNI